MVKTYFCDYKLHNGTNDGWAYNTELKTTDKAAAVRKYGEMIKQYYAKDPYDYGLIQMIDMLGNVVDNNQKIWDMTADPEPNE